MILLEHRLAAATKHRTEGRRENALAIYQEILDISPGNGTALKAAGEILLELGRVEDAGRLAAQAAAVAPTDIDTLALQAVVARASKDETGEILALEKAAALDPLHPATAVLRAERLRTGGDMAGSESILVDALRQHPEDTSLLNALSQTYMAAGLVDDALDLSLKAVKIEPGSAANLILLGSQLVAVGHHGAALDYFEKASLLDPANIVPMIFMADAHASLGYLTEAMRIIKRVIGMRPEQLAAWRIQARIRIQQGEVAEALRELSEAVHRHKDKVEALIAIGDAYRQAGEHEQALRLIDPLIGRHASLNLQHRQAVLAIARESRLSLGRVDDAASLMHEMGMRKPQPAAATNGGDLHTKRIGGISIADQARLASMPLLIGEHMSMLEALPLLRFRMAEGNEAPLALRGPAAFSDIAALLSNASFEVVEEVRPVPGVDGLPLPAILALPAEVRGPVEMSAPYIAAPQDKRATWRASLAHLPRPWVVISWNAGRPGLMLDDLLPLFADFSGSLISVVWDESRHQLAGSSHVIDAGVHFAEMGDLAAVLAEVDAVVGPDGLALHIAGAMRKHGAVLLQPNAPWYWCERQGKSLWYPSIQILKSDAIGHWSLRSGDLKTGLADFLADLPVSDDQPVVGISVDAELSKPLEGVL